MTNLDPLKSAAKAEVSAVRSEARGWIASHPFKAVAIVAAAAALIVGAIFAL